MALGLGCRTVMGKRFYKEEGPREELDLLSNVAQK